MEIEKAWDYLVDTGIATKEELALITHINGYSIDSLNSVAYARTGFDTVEQLMEEDK